jgi:tellurite resistance protein TerC
LKPAVKKIVVGIVGGVVLLAGIVMIVLPGPSILVIPAGLAILATEFQWAHNLKEKLKSKFDAMREKRREKKSGRSAETPKP